jgi:hypothetical protein
MVVKGKGVALSLIEPESRYGMDTKDIAAHYRYSSQEVSVP